MTIIKAERENVHYFFYVSTSNPTNRIVRERLDVFLSKK